jgi:hypothetical protein
MSIKSTKELIDNLLEQLDPDDTVRIADGAHLKIIIEDCPTITLEGYEIQKVLSTEDAVRRLFEAAGSPEDSTVELSGVSAPGILTYLEEYFSYVEEV